MHVLGAYVSSWINVGNDYAACEAQYCRKEPGQMWGEDKMACLVPIH